MTKRLLFLQASAQLSSRKIACKSAHDFQTAARDAHFRASRDTKPSGAKHWLISPSVEQLSRGLAYTSRHEFSDVYSCSRR